MEGWFPGFGLEAVFLVRGRDMSLASLRCISYSGLSREYRLVHRFSHWLMGFCGARV